MRYLVIVEIEVFEGRRKVVWELDTGYLVLAKT